MGICCCKSNAIYNEQKVALLSSSDVSPKDIDNQTSKAVFISIENPEYVQNTYEENVSTIHSNNEHTNNGNEDIDQTNKLLDNLTELNLDELDCISSESSLIYQAEYTSSSESQQSVSSLSDLGDAYDQTDVSIMDKMRTYLLSNINDESVAKLFEYIIDEEYDTECIYYDISNKKYEFNQSNICNQFSSNIYELVSQFDYVLLPPPKSKNEKKKKHKRHKSKHKKNKKKKLSTQRATNIQKINH
eukprot:306803_1